MSALEKLRASIYAWNIKFPLDYRWRQKHRVAYGSQAHLQISQADILHEFVEDEIYSILEVSQKRSENVKNGNWLLRREDVEDVSDEEFDKIEI